MAEDLQDTGLKKWETVKAALLSAIPFGIASACMVVRWLDLSFHYCVPTLSHLILLCQTVLLSSLLDVLRPLTYTSTHLCVYAKRDAHILHGTILT
jgi:hypothetical protein